MNAFKDNKVKDSSTIGAQSKCIFKSEILAFFGILGMWWRCFLKLSTFSCSVRSKSELLLKMYNRLEHARYMYFMLGLRQSKLNWPRILFVLQILEICPNTTALHVIWKERKVLASLPFHLPSFSTVCIARKWPAVFLALKEKKCEAVSFHSRLSLTFRPFSAKPNQTLWKGPERRSVAHEWNKSRGHLFTRPK